MSGYIKRGGWVVAVLLGWMAMGVSAQGASFDCEKAKNKVEHIICDNAEISRLDDELSVAYKAALKAQTQAEVIKRAQKQWMKVRNQCVDRTCLTTTYISRTRELTNDANVDSNNVMTKSKMNLCAEIKKDMRAIVSKSKGAVGVDIYKYELDKYILHPSVGGFDEKYADIDVDKDGVADKTIKSCPASNEPADPCYLTIELSSGREINFEAWHMFLIRYQSQIYIVVNQDELRSASDFQALRQSHTWQLYLLDESGATFICKNL